jgi:hypothetical protein
MTKNAVFGLFFFRFRAGAWMRPSEAFWSGWVRFLIGKTVFLIGKWVFFDWVIVFFKKKAPMLFFFL